MIRAVLTGSESTGKSMLAARLASHFGVEWVPEFVREYAEQRQGRLDFGDHGPIARGQMALEDAYRARADRLLIQDTDLVSTAVYCGHYWDRCPAWIEQEARTRLADLYLLMDIDVPWVADPARDRGHRRSEMHELFIDALQRYGAQYETITGDWDERFAQAVDAIQRLTDSHYRES